MEVGDSNSWNAEAFFDLQLSDIGNGKLFTKFKKTHLFRKILENE